MRNSYNWIYFLITEPLLLIDGFLLMYLLRAYSWATIVIVVILGLLTYKLTKKFSYMPHPLKAYGKLDELSIQLPIDNAPLVYASEKMGEFDFMGRIAEIASPFIAKSKNRRLIINKKLLNEYGEIFISIAICRELLKDKKMVLLKNYLGIALPVLICPGIIISYFAFAEYWHSIMNFAVLDLLMPFAIAIIFVASMFFWSSSISRRDKELDKLLLKYYPIDKVESFIKTEDMIVSKGDAEKSKVFNNHFLEERLKDLHSTHKR